MNASLLEYVAQCYDTQSGRLWPVSGGHYNLVYEFKRGDQTIILRISPGETDLLQTLSMMDYVEFLAENGAPVARPVASNKNRWVETVKDLEGRTLFITAFEKAPGILAETIPPSEWTPNLYRQIGRAVGGFHHAASVYRPLDAALRRPDWETQYSPVRVAEWLGSQEDEVLAQYQTTYQYLRSLPKDSDSFGLAHGDLHFANFLIEGEHLTLFDFDDCCYTWFAMDLAVSLFDALVINPGSNKESFAVEYLQAFLAGYRSAHPLAPFWVSQLSHFLKLEEIFIYALIYPKYDPADDDPWVSRFMPGRKERIIQGIPYVNVNFIQISKQV